MRNTRGKNGNFEQGTTTLYFKRRIVENAFLSSRKEDMLRNFSRITIIVVIVCALEFVLRARTWTGDQNGNITTSIEAGVDMLGVSLSLLARMGFVQKHISCRAVEIMVVFLICAMLAHSAIDSFILDVIMEYQDFSQDTRLLRCGMVGLRLDTVITFSHLALPVRWFTMVWVDVWAVTCFACYSWLAVGMDINPSLMRLNLLFLSLVAGASIGLRFQESHARELFATLADERSLRAQAEFKVEHRKGLWDSARQGPRPATSESAASSRSVATSIPMTTDTAVLFKEASISASLQSLQSLGSLEQWLLETNDLEVEEEQVLGVGGCGKVVAGVYCKRPVAIKVHVADTKGYVNQIVCNELRILRHVRHPNIVLFYGACINVECGDIKLVLERVRGAQLSVVINQLAAWKRSSPNATSQMQIMLQLCQALVYLHSRKPHIVHGDLKPSNVLVERHEAGFCPKILDFGLSCTVTRNSRQRGGTPVYMAPEVVSGCSPYPQCASDVFSMGRLLFYSASGRQPLPQVRSVEDLITMSRTGELPAMDWEPTTRLLTMLREIIERCMEHQASKRPPAVILHDQLAARTKMKLRTPARTPLQTQNSFPSSVRSSQASSIPAADDSNPDSNSEGEQGSRGGQPPSAAIRQGGPPGPSARAQAALRRVKL